MDCYCLVDSPNGYPMGTKRPAGTVFQTLANIDTSDRKLQPGGKVSLDPSPRREMSAKLEQGRDGNREEDWRREREIEKSRDKTRYRDQGPRDKHYERERDRGTVYRQREWREKERQQENDRRQNVRPLSNVEKDIERDALQSMKKGDTFPRMRRISGDHGRRNDESHKKRRKDRPKRLETDDWEREYEREQQRDRYRGRDKEEEQRRREWDESWERKERDTARKREKTRSDMGKKEPRGASPYRQREREVYSGRMERELAQRREGQRDTRSEGDSDEGGKRRLRYREYHHSRSDEDGRGKPKRERERDRQGYRDGDQYRYKDRDWKREVDQSRRRDVETARKRYREDQRRTGWETDRDRKGERWKDSNRDLKDDKRRPDISRELKQEKYRWENDKGKERSLENSTGRDGRAQSDMDPRTPPRAQSSGEWSTTDVDEQRSAEIDAEIRRKQQDKDKGGKPERRRMWLEPQRGKNSQGNIVDRERNIESQGEWGREEHRVKEEPDERFSDQSRYTDRQGKQNEQSGDTETENVSVDREMYEIWGGDSKEVGEQTSGRNGEIGRKRDAGSENTTDNTEDSDREEEEGGSNCWARSESDGGSDSGWRQEKDRTPSGEDDFVTLSSGGDEQEDRDSDEEQYKDCQHYFEGEVEDPSSPGDFVGLDGARGSEQDWRTGKEEVVDKDDQGSGKQPTYVFCVIGQTLPRNIASEESPPDANQSMDEDTGHPNSHCGPPGDQSASAQEAEIDVNCGTEDRMTDKLEPPRSDMGVISRDSMTETLLTAWRQKNKEPFQTESQQTLQLSYNPGDDVYSQMDFEQIQPILEGLGGGMMSPEEVEAIRIRLSKAWILSEEPKQHSQAPHLKWAKNVVREILGNSEEHIVDEISVERDGDKRVNQSENASNNVNQRVETSQEPTAIPVDLGMDAQHSDPELDLDESLELEGLRGTELSQVDMHADQNLAMHADTRTHTHADTPLHTGDKEEHSVGKENRPSGHHQVEKIDVVVETGESLETDKSSGEKEMEMYLTVSSTLYKPSSCPILSCENMPDTLVSSSEGEGNQVEDRGGDSEEDRQEERSIAKEMVGGVGEKEGNPLDRHVSEHHRKETTLTSSFSFRDLGPKARLRRRGVRKTTERKDGEHVGAKEEEGVGRDRRTRIFSTTGKGRLLEITAHSSIPLKMM